MSLAALRRQTPSSQAFDLRLCRPAPRARSLRRPNASQVRRILVWALATFVLVQVAVGFHLQDQPRDREYAARVERITRRTGPAAGSPLEVFALGSSRFQLGLRAAHLEKSLGAAVRQDVVAINFATPGGGPLTSLFTWRRLVRDGLHPDLALVEVHPALLSADRDAAGWELNERIWPAVRFTWSDLAFMESHASASRPGLRAEWLVKAAFPLHSRRFELVTDSAPQLLPYAARTEPPRLDDSGQIFIAEEEPSHERRERGLRQARAEYQETLLRFRLGGAGCEALRELLTDCRASGVPVALVLMPEGPEFRAWYPAPAWAEIHAWVRALSADHGAAFVDAHDWLGEEQFYDSHHLTGLAGARFTERLARQEIAPLASAYVRPRPTLAGLPVSADVE
jgi:hypothetical protein